MISAPARAWWRAAGVLLFVGLSQGDSLLAAQVPGDARPRADSTFHPQHASPLLPPRHWALDALARLEGMGFLPDYVPPQRAVSRTAAASALRDAVEAASSRDPAVAELAGGWVDRLTAEFPELADPRVGRLEIGVGFADPSTGRSGPAGSPAAPRLEPPALRSGAFAAGSATIYPARRLALFAEPSLGPDGASLAGWEIVAALPGWEISAGRRPIGYGFAEGGGVVLSGAAGLERLQAQTARALRLPGPLRSLGPLGFHGFVGRLSEPRHPGDPLMWGVSATLRPHPRLTLAGQRSAMFGSREGPVPLTARNVAKMLVGVTASGFDNQMVSASLRYRVPSEAVIPLTLYGEWGADDTAGAFWDSPGVVVGALLPRLPNAAGTAVGIEYAYFGNRCGDCRRVEDPLQWYSHFVLRGGWVAEGRPLGHPLGGNGEEARVYARSELLDSRMSLRVDAFARDRAPENLYAPLWAGRSRGADLRGSWCIWPSGSVQLQWSQEWGRHWSVRELRGFISVFL